ncbi:helix-turn-helix domain-containing protein [Ketogulonicigenium vulgare]|uniref:4-hydroxy-3-methylbut-2-en-1-yl diphosphate synthase n=1 Tax=Ketogulonicigenium vulgare (strain WSH-001) TaxID=759362 RepID=F9Y4A0_KETVW|nr:helix-turn-helix domain-containing protein [Ketogulonicigenium vulgare]ADO42343.1 conserved hypothetical protein [Ketogulonicigenium vulgare Y25]AEM40536.1 4-hydroxy-3-methylbut-2-en-1-yl diphosphate synthase [Ketogulonicigenium vulgare WSH-001]ALJ80723.1 4-hydroxy-3-methylbut-2-en-1-yl diphosphate synthase [Ketogulonicigenium vulgare]ANW33525.1 4-hydroxy-3-methylbut-2-en-1-yl diphosphate synthase [Ketogulonicigenium vulgare]AOZ54255.1 hypothetical protein KVC_1238 [Ketogulonicigenium vulga
MIRQAFRRKNAVEPVVEAKGFDDFELRLGDLMRGERATMGKSLLDVQRELKIKAAYIAAIENCDPSVFDTPGFIAGYVRSYARYLRMDPDQTFVTFCKEAGFRPTATVVGPTTTPREESRGMGRGGDMFTSSRTPFIPAGERMFSGIEPRAIGSIAVLALLVAGLGYGAWAVVQEVQRVQLAPVEQAPVVVTTVDRLSGNAPAQTVSVEAAPNAPTNDALARLYRPQALELPVLIARDGPISAIAPGAETALTRLAGTQLQGPQLPSVDGAATAVTQIADATPSVQVTDAPQEPLQLVAVRPAWVRVSAADGTILFEGIMSAGQTYAVPAMADAPRVRVGESGAMYLAVNGVPHGPVGAAGTVTSNIELSPAAVTGRFQVADLSRDDALAEVVRVAQLVTPQ